MSNPRQDKRELTPYQKKLLDPRWQKKRLEIFERDEWRCQRCQDSESTLQVHHRYYKRGISPWEYPDEALVTLCDGCHIEETFRRPAEEQMLLAILCKQGFLVPHVHHLSVFLSRLTSDYQTTLMFPVLDWAIQHTDVLYGLMKQYREWVVEQRKLGRGDAIQFERDEYTEALYREYNIGQ